MSCGDCERLYLFLVTDMVVFCRYKLKQKNLLRRHEKHRYHVADVANLTNAQLHPLSSSEIQSMRSQHGGLGAVGLVLSSEKGRWVLSASEAVQIQKWTEQLSEAIRKSTMYQRLPHNSAERQAFDWDDMDQSTSQAAIVTPRLRPRARSRASSRASVTSSAQQRRTPRSQASTGSNQSSSSQAGLVECPQCAGVLEIPANAHVMSCHFCSQVLIHRAGHRVGKAVLLDGVLNKRVKRITGSTSHPRYFILTKSELAYYKDMDTFVSAGESSARGVALLGSRSEVTNKEFRSGPGFLVTSRAGAGHSSDSSYNRVLELVASSGAVRDRWVARIQSAIQGVRDRIAASTPTSTASSSGWALSPRMSVSSSAGGTPRRASHFTPPATPMSAQIVTPGSQASQNVSGHIQVIPPGVDPDVFLQLPSEVQQEIIANS